MVFGAKLRTVMSSIIRWRNGETLRAVGMGNPNGVVLLMASNDSGKLPEKKNNKPSPISRGGLEKKGVVTTFPRVGF